MHQVSSKIMGVEPHPSSNQCFLRGCLDNLSAFLSLVQLDLFLCMFIHSLHWLPRWWLADVNGVLRIIFCGKCFTTSFPMSYKLQQWHPGGPHSFITGFMKHHSAFEINMSSVLQMVCEEKQLEASRRAHTRKKSHLFLEIISLPLSYETSVFIANLNSLFSHNICGPIMLQIYFLLHHMWGFFFLYHLCFVMKNFEKNEWKQITYERVQIRKVIWHYSDGITDQPIVGNDRDKIPASPGMELGQFIENHNDKINIIMVY